MMSLLPISFKNVSYQTGVHFFSWIIALELRKYGTSQVLLIYLISLLSLHSYTCLRCPGFLDLIGIGLIPGALVYNILGLSYNFHIDLQNVIT